MSEKRLSELSKLHNLRRKFMMTVGSVKMSKADDVPDICVHIDDSGYAYIKQDGKSADLQDWIALPAHKVPELIAALLGIRV